jgi:general secretion pathway protein D
MSALPFVSHTCATFYAENGVRSYLWRVSQKAYACTGEVGFDMKVINPTLVLLTFATGLSAADPPDDAAAKTNAPQTSVRTHATNGSLQLNFRGAPIDSVLRYLSEAGGFIIERRTEVRGDVDLWSSQPVSQDEAVDSLNSALEKNGYAVLRHGRTLTIVTQAEAKKQNVPVKIGNKPEAIPRQADIVTQIVPLQFASAVQVSRDLQSLVPEQATLIANESSNAIVITDTQTSIHRLVEIIHALDTAVFSTSSVRIFPLQYADAKGLASVLKDLFQPQDGSRSSNQDQGRTVNSVQTVDAGPPGLGSDPSQPADNPRGAARNSRAPTPRLVAVAEERSNSLVVSAPTEQMDMVASLIRKLDLNVQGITELRVFHLRNADAQDTADLLSSLFGGPSSNNGQNAPGQVTFGAPFARPNNPNAALFGGPAIAGGDVRTTSTAPASEPAGGRTVPAAEIQPRLAGAGPAVNGPGAFGNPPGGLGAFPGPLGMGGGPVVDAASGDQSPRQQQQNRVVAVADLRTGSVVVSAGRQLMVQIANIIDELDADASRKQQVFVYSLQNTDGQTAQGILESLFPSSMGTMNSQLNSRQSGAGYQLSNRASQNQSQRSGQSTSTGSLGGMGGGLGSSGGLGR